MKDKIIKTIINLFQVKSIITLTSVILFVILAYNEKLPIETTTMILGMVFTHYFTKNNDDPQ